MLAPVRAVVRFMRTLDRAHLRGVFAGRAVTIVENFAPYVFSGAGAVRRWTDGCTEHARDLRGLRATFGAPQEYQSDGRSAYFVLPTTWRGRSAGGAFVEHGAWSFVLRRSPSGWRVAAYAWGVTRYSSSTGRGSGGSPA